MKMKLKIFMLALLLGITFISGGAVDNRSGSAITNTSDINGSTVSHSSINGQTITSGAVASHTFDTSANGSGASDPQTLAFDAGPSATILVVGITYRNSTARAGGVPTFDGNGLTQVDATRTTGTGSVELWYLADPPTGGGLSISVPNTATDELVIIASSYISSGSSSTLDTSNFNTPGSADTISVTITPTEAGTAIVDSLFADRFDVPTANSHTLINSTDPGAWSGSSQYTLSSGTGQETFSYTFSGVDNAAIIVGSFKVVP